MWGAETTPSFLHTNLKPTESQTEKAGREAAVFILLKLQEAVIRSPCGHVCLFTFRLRRLPYKVIMSHWHGPAVQWDLPIRIMAQKGRAGNVLPAGS